MWCTSVAYGSGLWLWRRTWRGSCWRPRAGRLKHVGCSSCANVESWAGAAQRRRRRRPASCWRARGWRSTCSRRWWRCSRRASRASSPRRAPGSSGSGQGAPPTSSPPTTSSARCAFAFLLKPYPSPTDFFSADDFKCALRLCLLPKLLSSMRLQGFHHYGCLQIQQQSWWVLPYF